jgi:CDP-paratose 2-epimerase
LRCDGRGRLFGWADLGIFAFWLHARKEGRPLKYIGIDGQGLQVLDCLHPRDLIPLVCKQVLTPKNGRPQRINVSVGDDSTMSLTQLSDECSERWTQRTVTIDANPWRYDLPWVVLDATPANMVCQWNPVTSVSRILGEIADFNDTQSDWIGHSL